MNEFIEKIRKYSDYSGEDGAEDAAVEAAEKALGLTFAEDSDIRRHKKEA